MNILAFDHVIALKLSGTFCYNILSNNTKFNGSQESFYDSHHVFI